MEKLASDILDEDFIRIMMPIQLIQYFTGFQRIHVKHRFVTGPALFWQCYSCFIWTMNLLTIIYFMYTCELNLDGLPNVLAFKLGLFFEAIVNAINAYRNNFTENVRNSQLYVKLHKIDRIFKKTSPNANRYVFYLAISAVTLIVIGWCAIIVILNTIVLKDLCISHIVVETTGVGCYMEIVQASGVILYLAIRLYYINVALEKMLKKFRDTKVSLAAHEYHRDREPDDGDIVSAIHLLLEAWLDCIQLFQFPVLSFTVQIISWDFRLIQNVVTAIKNRNLSMDRMFANAVMLMLATTSMLALSLFATIFNSLKLQTRKICSNLLSISSETEGKTKKIAQDILMLLETSTTFSVYGIYIVDNKLPLRIFAITATYTIVLLQFATL